MNVNPIIEETIAKKVLAAQSEREVREPSGRLSASRLGWPLQWQMLHYLKIGGGEHDEYTLRKFQRGKDVEERIVDWLDLEPNQKQVECDYRGVVGIADVIIDYPIEIKSTTNMAFKHIQKEGPKLGHRLQSMLYAKALGYDTFGVAYVASDDYRVLCYECPVTDEVDEVIDAYEKQLALGFVPEFVPVEPWQALAQYNNYPEWQKLNQEQINKKLIELGINVTQTLGI